MTPNKKSQISAFLFLSMLLLFILLILFYYSFSSKSKPELEFRAGSISDYIDLCLMKTSNDALFLLGKQGGYLTPLEYIAAGGHNVSYLLIGGVNKVPRKEIMEKELSDYINSNLISCLVDFRAFKDKKWRVDYTIPNTTAKISIQDVYFTSIFHVTVVQEFTHLSFEKFTYSSKVRLQKISELSESIVNFSVSNPNSVDMTDLSDNDFEITVFPYEKKLIYSVKDRKFQLNGKDYMFNFAIG